MGAVVKMVRSPRSEESGERRMSESDNPPFSPYCVTFEKELHKALARLEAQVSTVIDGMGTVRENDARITKLEARFEALDFSGFKEESREDRRQMRKILEDMRGDARVAAQSQLDSLSNMAAKIVMAETTAANIAREVKEIQEEVNVLKAEKAAAETGFRWSWKTGMTFVAIIGWVIAILLKVLGR